MQALCPSFLSEYANITGVTVGRLVGLSVHYYNGYVHNRTNNNTDRYTGDYRDRQKTPPTRQDGHGRE